jgi:ubiquinone/menaquinone biosynthesis C-methylase UbiE
MWNRGLLAKEVAIVRAGTWDPERVEPVMLRELADFEGKEVLEIGAGDGRMTRMYAGVAGRVLALDTDAGELAKAGAAIEPDTAGRVVFLESSLEALEDPLSFDMALFAWSLC